MRIKSMPWAWMVAALMLALPGCGKEGKEGTKPLDCGELGTAHDGHCHCAAGALFDGERCVLPEQVTRVCGAETGAKDEHAACVCPEQGACPCDHGTVQTLGGRGYCVPEPDHDA
jgi:hypothetical protein